MKKLPTSTGLRVCLGNELQSWSLQAYHRVMNRLYWTLIYQVLHPLAGELALSRELERRQDKERP